MRIVAGIIVVVLALGAHAERLDTAATIVLENETLRVELYADRPAPLCYVHKPTGERMCGAGPEGVWRINGQDLPWGRWRVKPARRSDWTGAAYEMALTGTQLRLQVGFVLRDSALEMRIDNVQDPDRMLQALEWVDMPLLQARNPEFSYWREEWRGAQWGSDLRTVWHSRPRSGRIGEAPVEPGWRPTTHACVYKPDAVCAFVVSNCRLFPLLDRIGSNPAYAMSLNAYYPCPEGEALRARVVFVQDVNEDGSCDLEDYALWMNRQMPDPPDARFKTALWYKLDSETLQDAESVIRRVANLTGGVPQICQLESGQETGDCVAQLAAAAADFNATVSFPARLDCAAAQTEPGTALASLNGGFDAIADALAPATTARALHLCGLRDSAGLRPELEELRDSALPVMADLARRGVSVTAESAAGLPLEPAGLFSGLWRFDRVPELLPLYHGKVIAGCPPESGAPPLAYGCAIGPVTSGEADWQELLDQIYLRALLYHFYLEREWLDTERLPNGVSRVRFTRDTTALAGPDSQVVTADGITVAEGTERFIPRGDAIYAYSRDGSTRAWRLPPAFEGQPLRVSMLTAGGPLPLEKYSVRNGRIRLRLKPHTPVLIEK